MALTYHGPFDHASKPNIRLQIPPDPRYARTVRDAIIGFASLHGVNTDDLESLLFAVGEALANAIEHARSAGDIEVVAEVDTHTITARISDSGSGLTQVPPARMPLPDAMSEGGRGIPIMQRCADVFDIRSRPGGGTVVTLGRMLRNRSEETSAAS